jgi:hypothetical protein
VPARTPYAEWVLACTLAETLGMTAAASAAVAGRSLGTAAALALVVAGGLVEGLALGWAQARVLGRLVPALHRRRYLLATLLVAGLGWAGASAPAAFAGDSDGTEPALGVVVLGAAGLGLVMGGVLGAAQAVALRGAVRHPWRWVGASAVAWPPTMAVIFLGATMPSASWPAWSVLLLGPVTGVAAGGALGLVSGRFLPALTVRGLDEVPTSTDQGPCHPVPPSQEAENDPRRGSHVGS